MVEKYLMLISNLRGKSIRRAALPSFWFWLRLF
jgi:hypothetical protein